MTVRSLDVAVWTAALLIFSIYSATVSPGIAGGDSGEIVAEGCQLGTAHPPGYPLMTLLVHSLSLTHTTLSPHTVISHTQQHIHPHIRSPLNLHSYLCSFSDSLMQIVVTSLRHLTGSEVVRDTVALRVNLFCSACTTVAAVCVGYVIAALTTGGGCTSTSTSNGSSSNTNTANNNNTNSKASTSNNSNTSTNTTTSCTTSYSVFQAIPGVIAGMGMFAFSPLIWQYAITAEVFALNTLFAALIVWLVVDFSQRRQVSTAIFGAFMCGLALCNQHTIILFEVPLILWMLFLLRREIGANVFVFVKLSVAFIVGILPYAYLPIAAILSPKAGSWGHVTTFQGFLHHFLRRDYGTFQLFSGNGGKKTEGAMERTVAYFKDVTNTQGLQFAPYLALIGVGMCIFWVVTSGKYCNILSPNNEINNSIEVNVVVSPQPVEKNKKKSNKANQTVIPTKSITSQDSISEGECRFTGLVLVFTFIFYFGVFHSLSNLPLNDKLLYGVHQRFWMQPNILMFTFVGLGLNAFVALFVTLLSPSKTKPVESFLSTLFLVVAIVMAYSQCARWYDFSNQSQVEYFKQYAQSILAPLPPNAILIVNYDQQWTSIRYLQICEQFRPDITTLQLSMMTYKWFQHKHGFYQFDGNNEKKSLVFPGTYSTFPNSPAISRDNAFTLLQFIDANYYNHNIFLGGKVTHPDDKLAEKYDMVPVGLVSKFVLMSEAPNGTDYSKIASESWSIVHSILPTLPNDVQYPEETWEWTIGRDYKDRLMDTAAYVLASAIASANNNASPLLQAIYWLETALAIEGKNCAASLLKNLGLAHLHSVQNKQLPEDVVLQDVVDDLLKTKDLIEWPASGQRWKEWSAQRFLIHWGEFLKRPDAARDPQFSTIEGLYLSTTNKLNTAKQSPTSRSGKTEKAKKSQKKK